METKDYYCWYMGALVPIKDKSPCQYCGEDHRKDPWEYTLKIIKGNPRISIHELSHKVCLKFNIPNGPIRGEFFDDLKTLLLLIK
jgi:hypothetical protein